MKQELSCITINPLLPATASVIWLHGLGADANDFLPLIQELQLPRDLAVRFIFPNAPLRPVTINNGYVMRAWYDIVSMNIDQRADKSGIQQSVEQTIDLIKYEESLGIPSHRIILAGFSQGAVIALTTAITFDKKLGGLLALSGYFPFATEIVSQTKLCTKETPIFIAHGTEDTVIPYMIGLQAYHLLKDEKFNVSWHDYVMAHSVCDKEVRDISLWIQKILL